MKRIKKYTKAFLLGLNMCFLLNALLPSVLFAYSPNRALPEVHLPETAQDQQEISVADFNLREIIISCVEDLVAENRDHQLPPELLSCYARIIEGHTTVPTADVIAALPTLLAYQMQRSVALSERGQRPDAFSVNSPEAIVGVNNCDITKLLGLLAFIRSKIGTVQDSSCCDSVLGILGNACTILGPDATISGTLNDLVEDFYTTWTILANLQVSATVDFADTWTILAEIQSTLTNCCAQTQQDFADTWTILATIDVTATVDFADTWTILAGLQQTLTSCCAQTQQGFADTWTILADLHVSATVDFSSVFTALTDIKDTISTDFNQTWTILAALQQTLTTCCAQTQQDFANTWTILAAINSGILNGTYTVLNDIKITVSTDFNQTWTILAALNTTLTTCCAQTQTDFADTWTMLAAVGSLITFTALNDIKLTVSTDFNQTWTILAALNATVTTCCAQTQTDFNQTWTILAALNTTVTQDFANTWTILAALSTCAPIVITAPTTISSSGNYCLANDIVGTIIINANNVTLNLNSHQISGGAIGVQVNAGFSAVQVENGTLAATSMGVLVNSGASIISLQNLAIKNATVAGIAIDGTTLSPVGSVQITNANVSNCGAGIDLLNAVGASVTQCELRFNTTGLIVDTGSSSIVIDKVQTVSCLSEGILLNPNVAEIVIQNSKSTNNGAHGFIATGNAFNLLFRTCEAQNNRYSGFALASVNVSGGTFINGNISNVLFDTCLSTSNGSGLTAISDSCGFYISGNVLGSTSNATNLNFVDCISQSNVVGYSVVQAGVPNDTVNFVRCVSQSDLLDGFNSASTVNITVCLVGCSVFNCQQFAPILLTANSIYIDGCRVENSAYVGYFVINSANQVQIKNSVALNCATGFQTNGQNSILTNLIAQNCMNYGFVGSTFGYGLIEDCIALECGIGFNLYGTQEGSISNCIAQGCADGFFFRNGSSPWFVKSNISMINTIGFENQASNVVFVNNIAYSGSPDYSSGVTERTPVSILLSSSALAYWDNISA